MTREEIVLGPLPKGITLAKEGGLCKTLLEEV